MIVAQHGNFTLVVTHSKLKQPETKAVEGGAEGAGGEKEKKKEGEAEKKEKES